MPHKVKVAVRPLAGSRGRAGMTLVELMIAMAIFAIGMAMVAAAFPTAIQQSQYAMRETLSQIICENAVAICQTRLNASQPGMPVNAGDLIDLGIAFGDGDFDGDLDGDGSPDSGQNHFLDGDGDANRKFWDPSLPREPVQVVYADPSQPQSGFTPYGQALMKSRYGWLLLGRRLADGRSDFQFVVIPYIGNPALWTPQLTRTSIKSVDVSTGKVELANAEDLALGSPVIRADTGQWGFITSVDDPNSTFVTLSCGVDDTWDDNGGAVWVVRGYSDPPANPRSEPSPAIGCLVFRTGLPQ